MTATDNRIVQILINARLLDQAQLKRMQAEQKKWGGRLHHYASDLGFAKEEAITATLSKMLKVPRLRLADMVPDAEAMQLVTAEDCERLVVFPCALRDEGKTLWLAMSDPLDVDAMDHVRARAHVARVSPGVAGKQEILDAVYRSYTVLGQSRSSGGLALRPEATNTEFKIIDVAGRTKVRHVKDIKPSAKKATQPDQEDPSAFSSSGAVAPVDLVYQLQQLQAAHAQTQQILKTMFDLCVEKGVFTMEEFHIMANRR